MRRAVLLVVLLAFVVMPATARAQAVPKTMPHVINSVLDGSLTFVPYGDDPTDVYAVYALGVMTGPVQGLGMSNLFTFQMPTPTGEPINTRFFLVTANGDKITGTYDHGTTEPGGPGLIGRANFVITGGTGRFANATGTLKGTAYVTFMGFDTFEWPAIWTLQGTIRY